MSEQLAGLPQEDAMLENQENQQASANSIDLLQGKGINVTDIEKLKLAGLYTVESVQMENKKVLLDLKGITEARYNNILAAARKISNAGDGGFQTGQQVGANHTARFRVSTGSTEFDAILGGGIQSSSLVEVHGEYRTGKTQLCLTLAVTAQICSRPGKVFFVDTEGTFQAERIRQISERFNLDPDQVLDNILHARLYTSDQQQLLPQMIEAQLYDDQDSPYTLVIIDSMMALWRTDFSGRGELADRQQKLGRFLNNLKKVIERHNLALVFTNHVMSDPSGGFSMVPDPKKAVGGHVLAHAATTRITLRKGRDKERVAKIIDSPCMPENDATFVVDVHGVTDA